MKLFLQVLVVVVATCIIYGNPTAPPLFGTMDGAMDGDTKPVQEIKPKPAIGGSMDGEVKTTVEEEPPMVGIMDGELTTGEEDNPMVGIKDDDDDLDLTGTIEDTEVDDDKVTTMGDSVSIDNEKVWLFGVGSDWAPYTTIDESTGASIGFLNSLIVEACRKCGRLCDTVLINDWGQCLDEATLTGDGLDNGHYDGCLAYTPTPERENVMRFAGELIYASTSQIYARVGAGINSLEDLAGKKVGFGKYWSFNPSCLRLNGITVAEADVLTVNINGFDDLAGRLRNGDFDAAFIQTSSLSDESGLVKVGPELSCGTSKYMSVMSRKDVDLDWVTQCVRNLRYDNSYQNMCAKWNLKLGSQCI